MPPARGNAANLQVRAALPNNAPQHPVAQFLLRTWRGNILAVLGLVFAILGVAWAIYTGVLGLRYGALQTCATLYGIGKYSTYCNKTLDAWVTPAPMIRRHLTDVRNATSIWENDESGLCGNIACAVDHLEDSDLWGLPLWPSDAMQHGSQGVATAKLSWWESELDVLERIINARILSTLRMTGFSRPVPPPLTLCAMVVITIAAGIVALVHMRFNMWLFPPVLSSVRLAHVLLEPTTVLVVEGCSVLVSIASQAVTHYGPFVGAMADDDGLGSNSGWTAKSIESVAISGDSDDLNHAMKEVKRRQKDVVRLGSRHTGHTSIDHASPNEGTERGAFVHEQQLDVSTAEDGMNAGVETDHFASLFQSQQQALEDYSRLYKQKLSHETEALSDVSSDAGSEVLPKVQCVRPGDTTVTGTPLHEPGADDLGRSPEDLPSRPPRPQLWLLTSKGDLEPNNPDYPETMPAAPTGFGPPFTVLGSRGRPVTLKQLQLLESEQYTGDTHEAGIAIPMLARWLKEEGDPYCFRLAAVGEEQAAGGEEHSGILHDLERKLRRPVRMYQSSHTKSNSSQFSGDGSHRRLGSSKLTPFA